MLKLNCDKALALLDWTSTLKFNETVGMTVNWYKNYYQKKGQKDIYEYSLDQINQDFNIKTLNKSLFLVSNQKNDTFNKISKAILKLGCFQDQIIHIKF